MLIRTHLALAVMAILLFVNHVNNQPLFIFIVLVATLIPDIDSGFSTLGKQRQFRFLQFFVRHRGLIHSFTFCILVSIILAVFIPKLAFGFFLGYALHLFVDSFTVEGIIPFWPYSKKSSWHFKTGSFLETGIFLILLLIDILLIVLRFL